MPKGVYKREAIESKFWRFVDKDGPEHPVYGKCWICTSKHGTTKAKRATDYVALRGGPNGEYAAHRISWTLHFGAIPKGSCVLHKCDNRKCVRPDHLFLGTYQDNTDDMISKDRHSHGKTHPMTPFSDEDIVRIRKEYAKGGISQQKIANREGVNQTAISAIVRGATWKHLL